MRNLQHVADGLLYISKSWKWARCYPLNSKDESDLPEVPAHQLDPKLLQRRLYKSRKEVLVLNSKGRHQNILQPDRKWCLAWPQNVDYSDMK